MKNKYLNRRLLFTALFAAIFFIVLLHYLLWVKMADPLPDHDGQQQYYYPVLNYLRVTEKTGNEFFFLKDRLFDAEYSQGVSLLAAFIAFTGLSEQVLAQPFLLNVICILPFVFCAGFFRGSGEKFLSAGLIICFFPFSLICIKQFSLLGLTLACALPAILSFRSWIIYKKWHFLAGFVLFFWFSALLKHLGLLLLLNFMAVYLLWSIWHRNFSLPAFLAALSAIAGALPFYHFQGLLDYVRGSLIHNPYAAANPAAGVFIFMITVFFLLGFLPLFALFLRRRSSEKRYLPKIFRGGFLLLIFFLLFSAIVIGELGSPLFIALIGYGLLLPLFFRYDFKSPRGFIYLYIFLSAIPLLMLFRSGTGRMTYTVFMPVFLMLIQTVSETDSPRFRGVMVLILLVMSNFFPSFSTLNRIFGRYGREVYLSLFHSPHQNPLGWQNYSFGGLRREFIREISNYSFSRPPLFLVENFGPFTSALFSFAPGPLYGFPPLRLLERAEEGQLYRELYQRYVIVGNGLFDELFAKGDIPVLIFATETLVGEREEEPLKMPELLLEEGFSIESVNDDLFVFAFNQAILDYFRNNGFLDRYYHCRQLAENPPLVTLCTDKRLPSTGVGAGNDYGALYLSDLVVELSQRLLAGAWDYYERGRAQQAQRNLLRLGVLQPESAEIKAEMKELSRQMSRKYGYIYLHNMGYD